MPDLVVVQTPDNTDPELHKLVLARQIHRCGAYRQTQRAATCRFGIRHPLADIAIYNPGTN